MYSINYGKRGNKLVKSKQGYQVQKIDAKLKFKFEFAYSSDFINHQFVK